MLREIALHGIDRVGTPVDEALLVGFANTSNVYEKWYFMQEKWKGMHSIVSIFIRTHILLYVLNQFLNEKLRGGKMKTKRQIILMLIPQVLKHCHK